MLETLIHILTEQTLDDPGHISEDTVLTDDLGLSSFDLVNLACAVEDEFDIEIPDRMIRQLKTVGDVIRFIESAQ
ncbi:MAG: acyl carrier protein [Oscillospiraceae bacterium]|nr:acyl carrier protein [Oscillospiraceae bacterium]